MLLDARRQGCRASPSSTCWNMARRLGFWAHGRAESIFSAAGITEPRPPQKPESPAHPAVLWRRQTSNDVAGQAWYLGPLRARGIRFSPERSFICIKLTSFAIPARCDSHLPPRIWIPVRRPSAMSLACKSGACRGSERTWSARPVKNHCGQRSCHAVPSLNRASAPHARPPC
jgi:hypothetical protein